jgi:hypothetical protein
VGYGESAPDACGTALFAVPDGFKYLVPVLELVGIAQGIHEFVQDGFLGFARGIDQDTVVDESFRKTHVPIPCFLFRVIF